MRSFSYFLALPLLFVLHTSNSWAQPPQTSTEFIATQVQDVVKQIETRSMDEKKLRTPYELHLRATRNALTEWLYSQDFVEYSDITLMFSDKLMMGKILYHYLKADAPKYHPPVMGLKEFLETAKMLDEKGVIKATQEELKGALKVYFPEGFILKPPVSWATDGKGFYAKEAEVIGLLAQNDPKLYDSKEYGVPFLSPLASKITSGERWMIMGKIKNTSISQNKNYGLSSEFRIHTFQDSVIPGATLHRYGLDNDDTYFAEMNDFAQRFLSALPKHLTNRQAWSLDVFRQSDGQPILIEVNTNRGQKTNWSDFLRTPSVIAGYVNFFEQQYGWKFISVEGRLLRNGLGNLRSHLKHEFPYYLELVATANAEERKVILQDLKDVAAEYYEILKTIQPNKEEQNEEDYLVTHYVANAFHDYVAKVNTIDDQQWNEFVIWVKWFIEWDGK